MKRPGEAATRDEHDAEAAIAQVEAWRGKAISYAPMAAGLASPSHRGVDSVRWSVEVEGFPDAFFLKVLTAEHAPFVDIETGFTAARAAAASGATPAPIHCMPAARSLVTNLLPAEWRAARMDDLRKPSVLGKTIALKKAIHAGAALGARWTIFDRLRAFDTARAQAGVEGPSDLWWMLDWATQIETAILAAGFDVKPCHGDGLASNIMLGPDGAAMLVDFDEARDDDPWCEIGALLNEAFQFESEMEPGLEMFEGSVRRASLNRCRAYAVVDDLVWGLWGLLMDKVSPRGEIEFLKYAQWRLLRCRMALRDPALEGRLRDL